MGKQQIITSQIKDLDRILESKQDELIAGEGIILENNVISSSSLVITLKDNQSSYTFASNNTYEFILGNSVEEVDFILSTPENTKIENNILVHLYIGNALMEIDWGTDKFFNNEEPSIDSIGYYDIVYIWNNILNKWVCKVILISDEERITYKNYIVDVTLSGGSPSYIPESNEFEATINENNTIYNPQIDDNGKAIFTFNNIVESPENYALIEYLGNADYQPAEANIILEEVNNVVINLIPAGGDLEYVINMVDSNTDSPISNILVTTRLISMNNGYIFGPFNVTTDSYGEFSQYFNALKYGNYIYAVDFAGNENYESNSANYMIEFTENSKYYEEIALNPVSRDLRIINESNYVLNNFAPNYDSIYIDNSIVLFENNNTILLNSNSMVLYDSNVEIFSNNINIDTNGFYYEDSGFYVNANDIIFNTGDVDFKGSGRLKFMADNVNIIINNSVYMDNNYDFTVSAENNVNINSYSNLYIENFNIYANTVAISCENTYETKNSVIEANNIIIHANILSAYLNNPGATQVFHGNTIIGRFSELANSDNGTTIFEGNNINLRFNDIINNGDGSEFILNGNNIILETNRYVSASGELIVDGNNIIITQHGDDYNPNALSYSTSIHGDNITLNLGTIASGDWSHYVFSCEGEYNNSIILNNTTFVLNSNYDYGDSQQVTYFRNTNINNVKFNIYENSVVPHSLFFDNCYINGFELNEYNYGDLLNIVNEYNSILNNNNVVVVFINGNQVIWPPVASGTKYEIQGVDYTYVQEYNDMMGYPEGKIDYINKFEPGIIFKVSEGNDFYKTEYVVSVEDNSTIKNNNSMYDNSMYYDNGVYYDNGMYYDNGIYYDNSSITKCIVNIPDNMMITEVYGSGTYNNYMIDTMNNVVFMTTPYVQPDYQMNIVYNNNLYSNYTYPDMNNTLMWPIYEDNGITRQIPLQLFNNMLFVGEDYNSIMYGGERILISINNSLVESITDEYNNIIHYQYNLVPANVNMQINASRIMNGTYSHDSNSGNYSWNFNDQNIMIAMNSVVNFSNDDFVINSMIDIGNDTKVSINNGIILNPNNDYMMNNINRIIINTTWNTDLRLTNMYLNYCTINLGSKSIVSLVNTMIMDEEHPMNAIIQTAKDSYGDQVLSLYNCSYRVNDGNNDNSILITVDNYNSILQPDIYLSTATIFINGVKVQDGIEMH